MLSAFLISTAFLSELTKTNSLQPLQFFTNRFIRIYPMIVITVLLYHSLLLFLSFFLSPSPSHL